MTWEVSSSLAPAGAQAAQLAQVTWIFIAVCAAVYGIVLALVVVAVLRRQGAFDEHSRRRLAIAGGAVTTLVLLALLVVSARGQRGLGSPPSAGQALTVRVVARQWWWEFRYPGSAPDQLVTTANEMHIPAGQTVLLELVSRDVIHSFWAPSLFGKRDLIPGHDTTMYIQAHRPGVFRGQCAEFCGAQHAKMAFIIVAEPPAEFQAWLARQRQAAASPATAASIRGRALFAGGTCPMCHAISGTEAAATMGPDLTHLASRLTLAAGSIPNVRHHLAQWILDAQNVKPGNRMPPIPLADADLQDLIAYLETLQ
jgi:cytochrome c oxidase subunit II